MKLGTIGYVLILFGLFSLIFQFSFQLAAVAPTSTVTANFDTSIGTNQLVVGTQIDFGNVATFAASTARQTIAKNINVGLIRFFDIHVGYASNSYSYQPCRSWNEDAKTGSFVWTTADDVVKAIFAIGAEPMIGLGYAGYNPGLVHRPSGMRINPTTLLPAPATWAAYCAAWVQHFKSVGLPVRFYQIVNEPFAYYGWTPNTTRLAYYGALYNESYKAMKAIDSSLIIDFDCNYQQTVLDYFIKNHIYIDAIDYHKYDGQGAILPTEQYYKTDPALFTLAEKEHFTDGYPFAKSVTNAKAYYESATGRKVLMINSESNVNAAWRNGTDPRNVQMNGTIWDALVLRKEILLGLNYDIRFTFSGSKSYALTKPNGYGFGMIDSDNNKPWYPYWLYKMIFSNLKVGDTLYQSTATSANIRSLAWKHNGLNNLLLICMSPSDETIQLSTKMNSVNYSLIDNSISFLNSATQLGTLTSSTGSYNITFKGYSVLLMQGTTTVTPPPTEPPVEPPVAPPVGNDTIPPVEQLPPPVPGLDTSKNQTQPTQVEQTSTIWFGVSVGSIAIGAMVVAVGRKKKVDWT
jgi:hypothetical protein